MKATWLYRISAILFFLFALGHTVGFMTFSAPTAEARAVWDAMKAVHFTVDSSTFSYGGWYTGFGLSVTVGDLFYAYLAWKLGEMARLHPQAIGALGWMLCLTQVAGIVLCLLHFAAVPAVLSSLLTLLLAWAAWEAGKRRTAAR